MQLQKWNMHQEQWIAKLALLKIRIHYVGDKREKISEHVERLENWYPTDTCVFLKEKPEKKIE